MATIYKPQVVSYRLPNGKYRTPDGKRVTKFTPDAVRVEGESPTCWGQYTYGVGQEHQVPLSKSKDIAGRMLAKLAGDAQLARVGISDPCAEHRALANLEGRLDLVTDRLAEALDPVRVI
jgi:hypothetical protein